MSQTVERKYIFTTSDDIGNIKTVDGQVIALMDVPGLYYDSRVSPANDSEVTRKNVSANWVYFSDSLPDPNNYPESFVNGIPNTLYIYDTGTPITDNSGSTATLIKILVNKITGTDQFNNEIHEWTEVANNTSDVAVTTFVRTNPPTMYITGSDKSVTDTGTLLKRSDVFITVDGEISANGFIGGKASQARVADEANHATSADVATNDASGNIISSYIKTVTTSGASNQVVFTKGNGDTATISTYIPPVVTTTAAGLAPQIPTDTTKNVLYRDGWQTLDVSQLPSKSATNDSANQPIVSTYVKELSFNSTNRKLTYTKGNGTSTDISISDTTYPDYSGPGNGHGLVPASTAGDMQRYFRVDGTWQPIPVYTGATSSVNGGDGLVKAPQSTDVNKFLKGDGNWADTPYPTVFSGSTEGLVPSSNSSDKYLKSDGTWTALPLYEGATTVADGTSGAVPAPTSAEKDNFLKGDGSWSTLPVMIGATNVDNGASGVVPAPTSSDSTKFLRGNGTWDSINIPVFSPSNNGLVPMPDTTSQNVYLNSAGLWTTPSLNTTGATETSTSSSAFTNIFYGDNSTVSFTLQYTPIADSLHVYVDGIESTTYTASGNVITFQTAPTFTNETETFTLVSGQNSYDLSKNITAITSVKIDNVALVADVDYTQTGYNQITILSAFTAGSTLEVVYTHAQEIVANYDAVLANAKMYVVSSPNQNDSAVTFTDIKVYTLNNKLYSNDKEVATVDQVPTIQTDTSFTPAGGLAVSSKKYGNSYSISIDGTASSSISAGANVATTTNTFNKVYSVGRVGTDFAMFKLDGNAVTCDTAINSSDDVQVSFNAFA